MEFDADVSGDLDRLPNQLNIKSIAFQLTLQGQMAEITVVIKSSGEDKHEVLIALEATIAELKTAVAAATGVETERQRLIYSGKVLKDAETVASYNIKDGNALHLVKGPVKKQAASSSPTPTPSAAPAAPAIAAGQPAFNPLAGLTDARYAGYNIPMPSLDQLGVNTDGMAMPSEDQMSQMMDSPMFQESMRSMLSNPQMLDYLIEQSPQLRAMGPAAREMLQSDYMRNMLTNPQAMRSMMDFQRSMGSMQSGNANAFPAPGNPNGEQTPEQDTAASTAAAVPTGAAAANPFASMFGAGAAGANPFAAFGAGAGGPFGFGVPAEPPVADTRPPEEMYAVQLGQLNDMGFFDFDQNVRALRRSGGRVEGALEMLLSGNI